MIQSATLAPAPFLPRLVSALGLPGLVLLLMSCMTTRISTAPDCNTPANVSYTQQTVTAYFWGLKQPADIQPNCNPGHAFNHLNGVTVKSTFGHYLLSTVTLGIVTKRRVQWCCAPYVPPTDSL